MKAIEKLVAARAPTPLTPPTLDEFYQWNIKAFSRKCNPFAHVIFHQATIPILIGHLFTHPMSMEPFFQFENSTSSIIFYHPFRMCGADETNLII